MNLASYRPDAHTKRRSALARAIDGLPALLPAGESVSRNYPAWTYPYRAGSHFLYFVGLPLEGAFLSIDGDEHTLFLRAPALGRCALARRARLRSRRSRSGRAVAWSRATGSRTRSAGETSRRSPPPDSATRSRQTALLGREVVAGRFEEPDDRLADAVIALRLRPRRGGGCRAPPSRGDHVDSAHARRDGARRAPVRPRPTVRAASMGRDPRARHGDAYSADRHRARRGAARRAAPRRVGEATCSSRTSAPRPTAAGRATSRAAGPCPGASRPSSASSTPSCSTRSGARSRP